MAGERNKKETIRFSKLIPAGQSFSGATALFQIIKSPGTLERIFGKFYPGQQATLQVRPYLKMTNDRAEELVTYPPNTNKYLAGDDTAFDMGVDFEVNNGDQIMIDVTNTSANDYTLEIGFEVDYVGGTSRVV